jgi:hypothetical protein
MCQGEAVASSIPSPDEHLTNGWEHDLPAEDTLVRQAVLVHSSWPVHIARGTGKPWHSTPEWAGGWIGDRGALTNWVVPTQPVTDPAGLLAQVDTLFPGHIPYVLILAWPTPDLQRHGLVLLGHPPLMVRFPGPRPASMAPGVDVAEVRDADGLAVAERVLVEGYPMPEMQPLMPGDLLGPAILDGRTRVWVARVNGEPAAVAAAHLHAGVTMVEYVAALPRARGRGAGGAVTWAATLADPDRPAVLLASDDGRPVYERMGYQAVERWSLWLRPGK